MSYELDILHGYEFATSWAIILSICSSVVLVYFNQINYLMEKDEVYFHFENRFRGKREQIIRAFSIYDGVLDYCLKKYVNPRALDIGCGRGEWLEKLGKLGFSTLGIEVNNKMKSFCENLEINVIEGDAIETLKTLPDNSFSIISLFHVIEHLDFEYIDKLFNECIRLISSEGILLIETPSIDNLIVATNNFYIDETHITPINVNKLIFNLNSSGFKSSCSYYINSGPLMDADSLNLTRVLNGIAQDLSVISSPSDFLFHENSEDKLIIEKTIKKGLTTLEAASQFDEKLRSLEAKLDHFDLDFFNIRRNQLNIEAKLDNISLIYSKINNSIPFRLYKLIIKILKLLININFMNI